MSAGPSNTLQGATENHQRKDDIMRNSYFYKTTAMLGACGALILSTGCEQLPGEPRTQGAVIGGLGGAAAGAAVGGREHRLLGALIGGALGAGGGYVIGANQDRIRGRDQGAAVEAARSAETRPATVEDARTATTADLNNDGFVTMDEIVAMHRAGLSDDEIIQRMRATDQVFELTAEQERYLLTQGLSRHVIAEMPNINRELRQRLMDDSDVIGREPALR
jgi:hypothetical protein